MATRSFSCLADEINRDGGAGRTIIAPSDESSHVARRIAMSMKMYHVVLLKFPANKAHRAAEVFAALYKLRAHVPGFLSLTGGPYSSPEGMNQGYTHGCVMVF